MRFNPKANRVRKAIGGGVFALLVFVGAGLLSAGVAHGVWFFATGCFLIGAGYEGIRCLAGGRSYAAKAFRSADRWIEHQRYLRAEEYWRKEQVAKRAALRLEHIEEQISRFAEQHVASRLADLERAEVARREAERDRGFEEHWEESAPPKRWIQ